MKLENAELNIEGELKDLDNVVECLQMIYGTIRGTFPMNRDLGIDGEILDYPLKTAKTMLELDIRNQTEQYEKRVEVDEVTFTYDAEKDAIKPFIKLIPSESEDLVEDMVEDLLDDEMAELDEYERSE